MTPADKALTERLRGKHCCNADACNCDECAARIKALSAELAAVTDPIGAGVMRGRVVVQIEAGASAHDAVGERSAATAIRLQSAAIRALPLPTHADRLVAALDMPEVRALVGAARETWADACANHDRPPPIKYMVPYGGLVKLKAAIDALQQGAIE